MPLNRPATPTVLRMVMMCSLAMFGQVSRVQMLRRCIHKSHCPLSPSCGGEATAPSLGPVFPAVSMLGLQFTPPALARSDLARSSPSRIANQGINEGRCSFLKLLAAVSSALHHSKSSREGYDDTSKSICIGLWQLVGSGANCFADEQLQSAKQTLHALAYCC